MKCQGWERPRSSDFEFSVTVDIRLFYSIALVWTRQYIHIQDVRRWYNNGILSYINRVGNPSRIRGRNLKRRFLSYWKSPRKKEKRGTNRVACRAERETVALVACWLAVNAAGSRIHFSTWPRYIVPTQFRASIRTIKGTSSTFFRSLLARYMVK